MIDRYIMISNNKGKAERPFIRKVFQMTKTRTLTFTFEDGTTRTARNYTHAVRTIRECDNQVCQEKLCGRPDLVTQAVRLLQKEGWKIIQVAPLTNDPWAK